MRKGDVLRSTTDIGNGREYHAGDWEIVSETAKSIKLKLIKLPETIWGEVLNYNTELGKEIRVRKNRWGFDKYDDGSFQFYPEQMGIPLYFEPHSPSKEKDINIEP